MCFASIVTIKTRLIPSCKYHNVCEGSRAAKVAMASAGVDTSTYLVLKLPASRELHIKAAVVGLEVANKVLP